MARVLPRRLAPVLPTTYSTTYLRSSKAPSNTRRHSKSLHHPCGHCEIFAAAAPRRAWILVSESISGLPLSRPVSVIGLAGLYPTNNLIDRSLILGSARTHSSLPCLSGSRPQFRDGKHHFHKILSVIGRSPSKRHTQTGLFPLSRD